MLLLILKYIPGMHLRVSDDIEEIGVDMDQFDDEAVGEWVSLSIRFPLSTALRRGSRELLEQLLTFGQGLYDTEEGHQRRMSMSNVVHGIPVAAPASATVESKNKEASEEERYSQ